MPSSNLKRLTIVPVTVVPGSTATKYMKIEKQQQNVYLTASPHAVVVTALDTAALSHSSNPDSPTRSPIVFPSTWSPGLGRKLRWRLRQCSIWERAIFIAFIIATVVLFGALTGWGYAPDDSEPYGLPLGWRAPSVLRPTGAPRDAIAVKIFGGIMRTPRNVQTEVKGEGYLEGSDANRIHDLGGLEEPVSTNARQFEYQHLRYGAWQDARGHMVAQSMPVIEADNRKSNSQSYSDLTGGFEGFRNEPWQPTITSMEQATEETNDSTPFESPIGSSEEDVSINYQRDERKWRWQPQGTT